MMLKGLELIGDSPMYGGSYGDIWKGSFRGQEIAVKILRTFIQSDPTKILKVGRLSGISTIDDPTQLYFRISRRRL